jgi:hypothetical protein
VLQAVAASDVQWLLSFQLACTCQQLQQKKNKQQQQQQQQLLEQLFAALGVPADARYSSYFKFEDDIIPMEVLMTAQQFQLDAVYCTMQWLPVGCKQEASAAAAAAAVALASTAPQEPQQQQQQQQQQQKQQQWQLSLPVVSTDRYGLQGFDREPPSDSGVLPARLVQPLVLTLLQLCAELKPTLGVIMRGFGLANELLISCLSFSSLLERAAAFRSATGVVSPDGVGLLSGTASAERVPAAVALEEAYLATLHAMAQPLLHAVAPVALKAVRQVEQGLSRGVVNGSITVLPGWTAEQAAVSQAENLMQKLGVLVLHVIGDGE